MAASHPRLLAGVGDQSIAMFSNKWFRRLPIKIARIGVSWNAAVARDHTELNAVRAWLQAAAADHVEPMVTFGPTGGRESTYSPSSKEYAAAVKAFIRDFPQVKVYSPWNEPDFTYRSLSRNPGLAASYFDALVGLCRHCTIVAGDVYLPVANGLSKWLSAYKRGLRFSPVAWAIHPYDDVRAHTTSQIQTLERYAGRAQIWLDEISGVERRGHWSFPNQSPNAANNDERFLFALPKRFANITRIYHYEWQAGAHDHWDSGLLGPQGRPRPAYWTFANAVVGKLP
jgi:hypothetical protein